MHVLIVSSGGSIVFACTGFYYIIHRLNHAHHPEQQQEKLVHCRTVQGLTTLVLFPFNRQLQVYGRAGELLILLKVRSYWS